MAGRTRRLPPWVAYSVLRLLFFAVPLVAVYAVSGNVVVAAGVAAVIGLALSLALLGRQRRAVVRALEERRAERAARPRDEDVEDAVLGGTDQNASAAPRDRE